MGSTGRAGLKARVRVKVRVRVRVRRGRLTDLSEKYSSRES